MINLEEKNKEIVEVHEKAQAAMEEVFKALDAFDKIEIPYDQEQEEELMKLFTSITNRKAYLAKCFAVRYGGLFFM